MSNSNPTELSLPFRLLVSTNWPDLEELFGPQGACDGCWCMWWRIPHTEFAQQKGERNRRALKSLVEAGQVPGILAYSQGHSVGWCAVEPRSFYPVLNRSRTLRPVDDEPVWSVTCFFVPSPYRHRGMTTALLRAAIDHVQSQGGRWVEGYPLLSKKGKVQAAKAWTGFASTFEQIGFQ